MLLFVLLNQKCIPSKVTFFILINVLIAASAFGQNKIQSAELDIDGDGINEQFQFYYSVESVSENVNGFNKFCIISKKDTIWAENKYHEVWVERKELYGMADSSIENKIGLIYENDKIYIWVTEQEHACCLNTTAIYEWTKKSLKPLFYSDFEVSSIEKINGKRYMVGNQSMAEQMAGQNGDYFISFSPTEYRSISNDFQVDSALTQEKNIFTSIIEDDLNVFDAIIYGVWETDFYFLISKDLASTIQDREYGILSLIKLDREYFKKYKKEELRIIRNELFAYYGYSFQTADLKDYFSKKYWYKPSGKSSEEILNELSEVEKYNIELILDIEKKRF